MVSVLITLAKMLSRNLSGRISVKCFPHVESLWHSDRLSLFLKYSYNWTVGRILQEFAQAEVNWYWLIIGRIRCMTLLEKWVMHFTLKLSWKICCQIPNFIYCSMMDISVNFNSFDVRRWVPDNIENFKSVSKFVNPWRVILCQVQRQVVWHWVWNYIPFGNSGPDWCNNLLCHSL